MTNPKSDFDSPFFFFFNTWVNGSFPFFFLLHFQPRQGKKSKKVLHGWTLRRLNLMAKAWQLSNTREVANILQVESGSSLLPVDYFSFHFDRSSGDQGLHEDVPSSPQA